MALFSVSDFASHFLLTILLDIICEQIVKVESTGLEDWLVMGSGGEVEATEGGLGNCRSAVSSCDGLNRLCFDCFEPPCRCLL